MITTNQHHQHEESGTDYVYIQFFHPPRNRKIEQMILRMFKEDGIRYWTHEDGSRSSFVVTCCELPMPHPVKVDGQEIGFLRPATEKEKESYEWLSNIEQGIIVCYNCRERAEGAYLPNERFRVLYEDKRIVWLCTKCFKQQLLESNPKLVEEELKAGKEIRGGWMAAGNNATEIELNWSELEEVLREEMKKETTGKK